MVANLPAELLDEVERSIEQQPDMVLLRLPRDRTLTRMDVMLAVTTEVDVLILGASAAIPPPGICSHLLGEFPGLKILVVPERDEAVVSYWLGLRRRQVGRVSVGGLVGSVRRAGTFDGPTPAGES
jgi:hypothetical protein